MFAPCPPLDSFVGFISGTPGLRACARCKAHHSFFNKNFLVILSKYQSGTHRVSKEKK
jgi:hypothetical protein